MGVDDKVEHSITAKGEQSLVEVRLMEQFAFGLD
jgi:hypothetical protein